MDNHLDALKAMYFALQIQLGAFTAHGSHTDWTKSFPINAIGSSGNFTAKLGENSYKFGVEIRLSQFTLTKLVIVTPYYVLVNETEVNQSLSCLC